MKTVLLLLFITLPLILLLTHCSHTIKYEEYYWLPETTTNYVDSLKVQASLSKNYIEKNDLDNQSIYLRFMLVNNSSKILNVFWEKIYPIPFSQWNDVPLSLIFCIDDEMLNYRVITTAHPYLCDSCFTAIKPHDSLIYKDSIDVIKFIGMYFDIEPGNYWIQVIYKNGIFRYNDPNVWIGKSVSEKLRFTIK